MAVTFASRDKLLGITQKSKSLVTVSNPSQIGLGDKCIRSSPEVRGRSKGKLEISQIRGNSTTSVPASVHGIRYECPSSVRLKLRRSSALSRD
jgi:hypothetical protein